MGKGDFSSNDGTPAVVATGLGSSLAMQAFGADTAIEVESEGPAGAVIAINPANGDGVWGGAGGPEGGGAGTGVWGYSTSTGRGMLATSEIGPGIEASSNKGPGVYANSVEFTGIYAYSAASTAVYATSGTGNAVAGFAQQDGACIVGSSPTGLAGLFFGPVVIFGALTVTGAKSAAVPHQDGTYRVLYSLEAPESWFEDFGSGEIQGGTARVEIDPAFVEMIVPDSYHVFVTPLGDCRGLYLSKKSRSSFEVKELQGGKSSLSFDYRIVAKRRDIEAGRFERLTIPTAAEHMIEEPKRPPRPKRRT